MQDQTKSTAPQATPKPEPALPAPSVLTQADLAKVSGAGSDVQRAPHSTW